MLYMPPASVLVGKLLNEKAPFPPMLTCREIPPMVTLTFSFAGGYAGPGADIVPDRPICAVPKGTVGDDVLIKKFVSPPYTAVIVCIPPVSAGVLMLA